MIKLCVPLALVALVAACTAPLPPERSADARPQADATSGCAIRLIQDGQVIRPAASGGFAIYELAPHAFRVEVPRASCRPSIALPSSVDFASIAAHKVVATVIGYEASATPAESTQLAFGAGDARTTLAHEIDMATRDKPAAMKAYQQLCSEFGGCPEVVRAYRSYWPFLGGDGEYRSFAEIERFSGNVPLSTSLGTVPVIVYTEVGEAGRIAPNFPMFRALAPHALLLRFR